MVQQNIGFHFRGLVFNQKLKSLVDKFIHQTLIIIIVKTSFLYLVLMSACKPKLEKNTPLPIDEYQYQKPDWLPAIETPNDNKPTQSRVELGKMLFFDPILSKDSTISCASCHIPNHAFADVKTFSVGVGDSIGFRNAPPLFNIAYHTSFFRDGGVLTLEGQVLAPIENPLEMNMNYDILIQRLKNQSKYIQKFREAYNTEPSLYSTQLAIAAFERSIISANSPFDKYFYGKDTTAISEAAIEGFEIFNNKAQCNSCHVGFDFSNRNFENNGLYETYQDMGRFRITTHSKDIGRFKVPSLRNLSYTAPYMHDGSLYSLEAVIEHYNQGLKKNPYQSNKIKPLNLSIEEKQKLIEFLESLNDEEFVKK